MKLLTKLNEKAEHLERTLTATPRRAFWWGFAAYTILTLTMFCVQLIPNMIGGKTVLGGDGVANYYPLLCGFRENLRLFIESVKAGAPQWRMLDFNFCFGADTTITALVNFLPLFPVYALSVFLPLEQMPLLIGISAIIMSYLAGLAFMKMCRHFGKSPLWSGVFATFYAGCNYNWGTGIYNPQFIYMMIAAPLMVVGLDRAINRKGWKLLAFSMFYLTASSFTFAIYVLPFLALFALIRVYYSYPKQFFRNLFPAFFRCLFGMLVGLMLSAVIMLPTLKVYFNSIRGVSVRKSLSAMLIPSMQQLSELLTAYNGGPYESVCAVVMPFVLFAICMIHRKRELKSLLLTMMLLCSMPVIFWGINGFQYAICRWGFLCALLLCYCAVDCVSELRNLKKCDFVLFIVTVSVYGLLWSLQLSEIASALLLAVCIITWSEKLSALFGKLLTKLGRQIVRFVTYLHQNRKTKVHYLTDFLCIFGGLLVILLVGYIIASGQFEFIPLLLAFCGLTILLTVLLFTKKQFAPLLTVVSCICGLGISVWYYAVNLQYYPETVFVSPLMQQIADAPRASDSFGRSAAVMYDFGRIAYEFQLEKTEDEMDGMYGNENGKVKKIDDSDTGEQDKMSGNITEEQDDKYITSGNKALIYQMNDVFLFNNMMDGDYYRFLERSGAELGTVEDVVSISGYSSREELYALMSVNTLYADLENPIMFGLTETGQYDSGEKIYHIYNNDYALPAGVTYDTYMSREQFEKLSGVDLSYAALQAAYIEGEDTVQTGKEWNASDSYDCPFSLSQELLRTTYLGTDVKKNIVELEQDVTGCFLFLTLEGVDSHAVTSAAAKGLHIAVDEQRMVNSYVLNEDSTYPWIRHADFYTIALGYCEENVKKLQFESVFNFENLKLQAIPRNVLEEACAARRTETLQNVQLGCNELTGDITVSSEKLLSVSLFHNDGWRVYVDGKEAELKNVNTLFLGVMLPAGTHQVRFVYRTPFLTLSLSLAAAALLLMAADGIWRRKKQKSAENGAAA